MAELGERQAAILRAVVREYIRTGEPIGSRHVVDRSRLEISSATVRNEMARLEELGYLQQPHTSAGRIPTDLGYRFVVDEIKRPRALAEGQRRALAEELGEGEPASLEDLLRRATEVASRFTHHAAAVLGRRARPTRLRRIELFPVAAHTAMLVLIAENGRVEQRMIPLDGALSEDDVRAVGDRLGKELQGVDLERAAQTLAEAARSGPVPERALLDAVADGFDALLAADSHLYVGGVANLAGEGAFDRDELHRLYEALEQQTALLELLASALDTPVTVRIGSELPGEDLRSCSIVIANFGAGDTSGGSVSVIGPTRMDYDRVIATANTVARLLEGTLGEGDRPS